MPASRLLLYLFFCLRIMQPSPLLPQYQHGAAVAAAYCLPAADGQPLCTQVMEDVASAIALPVDFEESEDTYSFIADVPGLEKGDIKVGGPPQHAL